MSHDEFVDMMVLDGCFAIEMFQGFAEGFEKLGYPPNDPVFSMRGSILQIQRDMIMLENQIPFFILDRLLGLQLGYPNQKERMAKLALQFFNRPWFYDSLMLQFDLFDSERLKFDPLRDHGRVHCLEVFRRSLLYLGPNWSKTKQWSQSRRQLTFCLTDLQEAGIQIRCRFAHSSGDIQFKDGILEIPPLKIHEGTRSLFLNLIAFEQSHFNCSNYVTSYVIFRHNLINSPEEVRYLRRCKIIEHSLGSDAEVADLFHRLCQEVPFNLQDSYLWDIYLDLREYCFGSMPLNFYGPTSCRCCGAIASRLAVLWNFLRALPTRKSRAILARKCSAWKAILETKYFDSPWSITSLIAAFVLLGLTFLQAFYAVYAYYRPRS